MPGLGSDDPLFTPADGPSLPTLRPRFHPDDNNTGDDSTGDGTDRPRGGDRGTARRSLRLRLGAVGLVLAVILAAFGVAGDLLRPDPPPDRPDLRVMTWWWDAFDTFPKPLGSGPWKESVCGGDEKHARAVIDAEIRRQATGWPAKEWVVSVTFADLAYTPTGEGTAAVTLTSITEFHEQGTNGFNGWAAPDQAWSFALERDGDQWCVHRIAVQYRPGFDPAEQTPGYGAGGFIGGAPGGAADDDTIGGGVNGEAHG